MNSFKEMGLVPQILKSLEDKGYDTPTPIQNKSIKHLLDGKDLLGIAQTGTGKTAAFSLPIIQKIHEANIKVKSNHMLALILVPTRELASQIEENIVSYANELNIRSKVIFGGVGQAAQISALRSGLEFVIATPGRLLDLTNSGHVKYDQLQYLVLDESDRMLDMGMYEDIKKILKKLPTKRQNLLFSATMPKNIEVLAKTILNNPIKIEITPESSVVDRIEQSLCYVSRDNKMFLLTKILTETEINSALVFSRTKHGADRIVKKLAQFGVDSCAIHGNKSQNNREKSLENFKSGKIKVMVATDIAARGIDIEHIDHVINFNLPEDPTSYVHRIGRTARANRSGTAISFCDGSELTLLKSIEKHIKQKIPLNTNQPFHEEKTILEKLAGKVEKSPRSRNNRRGRR